MKTAWLFPGQGAQAVGMAKDVYDLSAAARAAFSQADEALGEPLSTLCFEGPMERLTLTANTQPAIVATSAALLAAIREAVPNLPDPNCAAGRSLGEYSALCGAGVIELADAVRVCRVRGAAMQEAVAAGAGAMAAVMGVEDTVLEALCGAVAAQLDQVVSPANFNAPGQTVIAGHVEAVHAASARLKEQGGKVIPLKVSAPFHCQLMAPARKPLGEALGQAELSTPRFDVLANVDAALKGEPDAVVEALLAQIDSPVRWVSTIRSMRERGVTHALEIGPGRVLAGLARRIDKDLKVLSVNGAKAIDKIPEFLQLREG